MGEADHARRGTEIPGLAPGIDAACDRFEAEWHAGHRPRIEDTWRAVGTRRCAASSCASCSAGDRAGPRAVGGAGARGLYRERFPSDAALVDAILARPAGDDAHREGRPSLATTMTPFDLAPGTAIARYVVLARLDEGGEALLYRVLHAELGKPFVLKLSRRPTAARATAWRPRAGCWPSSIIPGW